MHERIKKIYTFIQQPWVISGFLLLIYIVTTGYKFGWDDQHVEIPLLKSLIDPALYPHDYYVESLKINFSSFFYPILAKLITINQIPTVYFSLFLVSRYFLIYFSYKLWLHISQNKLAAFCCLLNFLLVIRVDEFLYQTFSHQEFALGLIAGGIYFFFKERFILASFLFGITANIHGLYSLFPMIFLGTYLLLNTKKHSWSLLLKSSVTFLIMSAPFIVWVVKNRLNPNMAAHVPQSEWMPLFLLACPQNFALPFPTDPFIILTSLGHFIDATKIYLALTVLFLLNLLFNDLFRKNTKAIYYCLTAFGLLFIAVLFTSIFPIRFFLDLNLVRNTQYLLYLLSGYTTIMIIDNAEKRGAFFACLAALLLMFMKFTTVLLLFGAITLLFFMIFDTWRKKEKTLRSITIQIIAFIAFISSAILFIYRIHKIQFKPLTNIHAAIGIVFCISTYLFILFFNKKYSRLAQSLTKFFILIPLILFTYHHIVFHYQRHQEERYGKDFWELRRNWVDMQKFVQNNTPKNSILLVPHDIFMGGFRIHSERTIIASSRDCGIIGFDYGAAKEWHKRIADIESFRIVPEQKEYTQAITIAISKYHINYIVFLNLVAPQSSNQTFERIYHNKFFTLVKVKINNQKSNRLNF